MSAFRKLFVRYKFLGVLLWLGMFYLVATLINGELKVHPLSFIINLAVASFCMYYLFPKSELWKRLEKEIEEEKKSI